MLLCDGHGQINGPITIAIRARFEYDSTTIRLKHATTRYEVFRALAYEIVYENQWYGPITIAIRARFEYDSTTIRLRFGYNTLRDAYDSTTIRARYNILRGVMCFRAIMNMSILSRCRRML